MFSSKEKIQIKTMFDAIENMKSSMKSYVQRRFSEQNIDMTYEMLQVMMVLWRKKEVNQQEIADSIQKNKATLTSLIDNLVKRKLVIRTEDKYDRRNKLITLTTTGQQCQSKVELIINNFHETVRENIKLNDIDMITLTLNTMTDNLNKK